MAENFGKPRAVNRRRELFELIVGYGLILTVIWTPGAPQRVLYWLAFAFIVGTSVLRRDRISDIGLGVRGLVGSSWVVAAALVFMGVAIGIAKVEHTYHALYSPPPFVQHVSGYLIWAMLQQFIMQVYILLRLLRLGMTPGRAVLLTAALFTIAHIPNPVLVALTLVWGLLSSVIFLRYRNVYTLGLAHGILGICIAVTVPNHLQHHMRVGLGYLRWHPHRGHRASAGMPPKPYRL